MANKCGTKSWVSWIELKDNQRGFRGTPTRVQRHRIYILIILLYNKYGVVI